MKLTHVHVNKFPLHRRFQPRGKSATNTCLVGKNESGKTAFLKALEGLRSVDSAYTEYNRTRELPSRYLADYEERTPTKKPKSSQTVWQLERGDKDALANEFGDDAMTGDRVTISKSYGSSGSTWSLPIDEAAVVRGLMARFGLSDDEKAPIEG